MELSILQARQLFSTLENRDGIPPKDVAISMSDKILSTVAGAHLQENVHSRRIEAKEKDSRLAPYSFAYAVVHDFFLHLHGPGNEAYDSTSWFVAELAEAVARCQKMKSTPDECDTANFLFADAVNSPAALAHGPQVLSGLLRAIIRMQNIAVTRSYGMAGDTSVSPFSFREGGIAASSEAFNVSISHEKFGDVASVEAELARVNNDIFDSHVLYPSPWPAFASTYTARDIVEDVAMNADAYMVRRALDASSDDSQYRRIIGYSEGFIGFLSPALELSDYRFDPSLSHRIFPDQMVQWSVNKSMEAFVKDPYNSSVDALVRDLNYDREKERLASTTANMPHLGATDPILVNVVFEHVDFPFHVRELFGNNFMDMLEIIQIVSTQGRNTYLSPPRLSDYRSKKETFDKASFDSNRQKYYENYVKRYGIENFNSFMKPAWVDSFDRYWGFGGASDNREWNIVNFDKLFDLEQLDVWLRSRGSGGIYRPDIEDIRLNARQHAGEQVRSLARVTDILILTEPIAHEPTQFVRAPKKQALVECEDSDIPMKIRFFRDMYYVKKTRCVMDNTTGHGRIDFGKLKKILLQETHARYVEELENRKRAKIWRDVITNSGHNAPCLFGNLEKLQACQLDYAKFGLLEDDVEYPGRERNTETGALVLRVAVYSSLMESMEAEKMHVGRYQSWSENTIATTSAWRGIYFQEKIREFGNVIRQSLTANGKHYWALHWRRGDAHAGPTEVFLIDIVLRFLDGYCSVSYFYSG